MHRKQLFRGLLQIAISAILLFLIVRKVNWPEVRGALWSIDLRWLVVAWVLFLIGVVVRAARWQVLLRALEVPRGLGELANWYFVGSFFNVILPTGFGGDAVRVAELGADTRRMGPVLNSVLVDRYMGIIVLLPMGLVAGLLRPGTASQGILWLIGALFAGGLLAAWLVRQSGWAVWSGKPGLVGAVVRRLRLPALAEAVAPYDRRTVALALLISLAFNLIQIGWNVAIAHGLGLRLPLATFLAFVPLTAVALLLPAFGGLGVRDWTYVGLFSQAGVPSETALALSLGVYAITVATGLVGGLLYLLQGVRRTGGWTRQQRLGTRHE